MQRSPHDPHRSDLQSIRTLTELATGFVIAVILLRGLILEGYLISTGSMAPGLLGYHKQVTCPSCEHCFPFGISFDESVGSQSLSAAESDVRDHHATCPNCGQVNIDVSHIPVNHGDQLLVHKNVFDLRRPRRWETVVFQNPKSPREAYVKRVVALPGESIRIIDGDLFIGGRIARKEYSVQQDMRIPVFDIQTIPDTPDWELPWQLLGEWNVDNGALLSEQSNPTQTNWLRFRHWRWYGGNHTVEVPLPLEDALPDWVAFLERFERLPVSWATRIAYDREKQVLRCHGVMPVAMQDDLVRLAANPKFSEAVHRLAAMSHVAPLTDRYGYNAMVASPEFPVRDVMLQVSFDIQDSPEAIAFQLPVMNHFFEVNMDFNLKMVRLFQDGAEEPVRETQFRLIHDEDESVTSGMTIEISNFDHRVLMAINGQVLFAPLDLPLTSDQLLSRIADSSEVESGAENAQETALLVHQQNQLSVGISGGRVQIRDLKLFRDVYYTPGRRQHAVDDEFVVPDESYFVHGDNSPVSSDSRSWEDPCVPHRLLVGKPFVVHLPSKPGRLAFGSRELSIRIPDFNRIRYIH